MQLPEIVEEPDNQAVALKPLESLNSSESMAPLKASSATTLETGTTPKSAVSIEIRGEVPSENSITSEALPADSPREPQPSLNSVSS